MLQLQPAVWQPMRERPGVTWPSPASDWSWHSWCSNCNIFPCSCYDINDSTFTQSQFQDEPPPCAGGSTGPVVLHKVWFVCQDRQQAGWRTVKSHVFGRQLWVGWVSGYHSTHSVSINTQTSVLIQQPHPATSLSVSLSVSQPSLNSSRSFQHPTLHHECTSASLGNTIHIMEIYNCSDLVPCWSDHNTFNNNKIWT